MNFFSAIGDGEVFFYYIMVFFTLGHLHAFSFIAVCYTIALHFTNWLKLVFHSSRPQFDDPTLGQVNATAFCSAEFGQPSGHALTVA